MSNTTNTESFAQLFEESLAKQEMRQGEVITAEVLRVEHNFVVVNAGLKSEAYVPIEEFKDDLGEVTVQPGDFVSVAIESAENGFGETVLSRDKAKRLAAWMNLEQALERAGAKKADTEYGEDILSHWWTELDRADEMTALIKARTSGRVRATVTDTRFEAL